MECVDEWIEVTEKGVTLHVEAHGNEEYVDVLKATVEGGFEVEIRWLGNAVKLEIEKGGKRCTLQVEVDERPWFLLRRELEKLMLDLGPEEVLRNAIDDLYNTLLEFWA